MYKLVISDDEGRTTVVPLVRDEITIGREEGNTIRLTERNVSRKHARLRRAEGRFAIEDLESYNGVKLNGSRIDASAELTPGDQLLIGDYRIGIESEQTSVNSDEVDIQLSGAHDLVPPARLVMLSQPAPGAEFALGRGTVKIGRDEIMDVWVNHRSISREHAEIRNDDGAVRIVDLESANGVRLNDDDIEEAELAPGDIVELGQVRFRYVGEGEVFAFDATKSDSMRAETQPDEDEDDDEAGGVPMILAVLVLGAAVGVGAAIATGGGDAPEPNTPPPTTTTTAPSDPDPNPEPEPEPGPTAEDRTNADAASNACALAVEAGDLAGAITHADRAIALMGEAGHEDATNCRAYAAQAQADAELFERAKGLLENGDFDAAYFAMESLSDGAEQRSSEEFAAARDGFAMRHATLARRALRTDPQQAANQAQSVLQTPDLPARIIADAQRTLDIANRRLALLERRNPMSPDAPPPTMTPSPMQTMTPDMRGAMTPGMTAAPPDDGRTPMDRARSCLREGNYGCVVTALDGRAGSPAALDLLIRAHQRTGNGGAARRQMRNFVQRYPNDRRAANYQRQVGGGTE